jgi:hypothetical protein
VVGRSRARGSLGMGPASRGSPGPENLRKTFQQSWKPLGSGDRGERAPASHDLEATDRADGPVIPGSTSPFRCTPWCRP